MTDPRRDVALRALRIGAAGCGLFAVTVCVAAAALGVPLTPPTERVSIVLGVNAVLPVVSAAVLFLASRLVRRDEGPRRCGGIGVDLAALVLFLGTIYFHFNLKMWIPLIHDRTFDEIYFDIDQRMRPVVDGCFALRQAIGGFLPGVDHWYQIAFLMGLVVTFCYLAVARDRHYLHFVLSACGILAVGGWSYAIAPAVGPFLFEPGVNAVATDAQAGMLWAMGQLREHGPSWIEARGADYFTGALSAMPSLHLAHALSMTWFHYKSGSPLTPVFALLFGWFLIESVASRWHYVVDIPVGLVIGGVVIAAVHRLLDVDARVTTSRVLQPAVDPGRDAVHRDDR